MLGLGNTYIPEEEDGEAPALLIRMLKAKAKASGGSSSEDSALASVDPAKEYRAIGLSIGEILWTLRLSLGDGAAITASKLLDTWENDIFWILWIIVSIVTSIIFLNFIVAEASASYVKVTEILEQVIWQEKASLILEAEEMANEQSRTKEQYPKYIICRQVE